MFEKVQRHILICTAYQLLIYTIHRYGCQSDARFSIATVHVLTAYPLSLELSYALIFLHLQS